MPEQDAYCTSFEYEVSGFFVPFCDFVPVQEKQAQPQSPKGSDQLSIPKFFCNEDDGDEQIESNRAQNEEQIIGVQLCEHETPFFRTANDRLSLRIIGS